ncbi:hypothetical protein BDY21DRAFT_330693 [Lineolata rhizophorae]|uniref:Uncharacterized protein n=1 Tax=Lineolata rhizophorae TaxID=578093 RepID=A0A6A6PEN6_9PEZI|nr:hypothetical protein BDY21DRAFT_330693 [Lineolata rhizophorae]
MSKKYSSYFPPNHPTPKNCWKDGSAPSIPWTASVSLPTSWTALLMWSAFSALHV